MSEPIGSKCYDLDLADLVIEDRYGSRTYFWIDYATSVLQMMGDSKVVTAEYRQEDTRGLVFEKLLEGGRIIQSSESGKRYLLQS